MNIPANASTRMGGSGALFPTKCFTSTMICATARRDSFSVCCPRSRRTPMTSRAIPMRHWSADWMPWRNTSTPRTAWTRRGISAAAAPRSTCTSMILPVPSRRSPNGSADWRNTSTTTAAWRSCSVSYPEPTVTVRPWSCISPAGAPTTMFRSPTETTTTAGLEIW